MLLPLPPATRLAAAIVLSALAALGTAPLGAQSPPTTDIFLVPITRTGTTWTTGVPANVSRRAGYDNQPAFAPDARSLYFTSIRDDAQADIWRNDFSTGITAPVRVTAESEYSALPTRDGSALTVVRVEADSAQRLWRLPVGDGEPTLLVPDVRPVGYFAFADDTTIAMFVLGRPATLQVATIGRAGTRTIARNIGRSLHRIPGTSHISYVQKDSSAWHIMRLNPHTGQIDTLTTTRPRREDYAWLDGNTIVMGDGAALHTFTLGDSTWRPLGDYAFAGIGTITRVAVSRDANDRTGAWLAIAADVRPANGAGAAQAGVPDVTNPETLRARPTVSAADVHRDIHILAADSMEGRMTGEPGGHRAARWLAEEFARAGLQPAGDSGTFLQGVPLMRTPVFAAGTRARPRPVESWAAWDTLADSLRVQSANVVGVIPGADPARRHQVVLVTAHYDHIGIGRPVNGDSINNGADDDASGTVAMLEIARQLGRGTPPARTIVFAAVTGEEVGLLGTKWYIDHPVRPLDSTIANVNIEMIGRPDSLTGGHGRAWLTGYERSTFGDLLTAQGVPIVPDPRPAQRFFERSDNIDFARRGIPAHTLSSFNLHGDYHTPRDEAQFIDTEHMARVIEATIVAVRALANGPDIPRWHPGGRPAERAR